MSGDLVKLKIQAFSDSEMNNKLGNPYVTNINPEKYSKSYVSKYVTDTPTGGSQPVPRYVRTDSQELNLEFLFDRTGIFSSDTTVDVEKDIDDFKKIIYSFNGDEHRPNYLKIYWGTLIFNCILLDLQVEYKLFRSDGNPIRAVAKAKFISFTDDKKIVAEEKKSSPDLTHVRVVKAGDTLPLMCFRIYGDSKYYVEVARVNKITSFRTLTPGQQIYFPPIEKRS